DAGEAVEAEQVRVTELEIEAVLVRVLVELASPAARRDDQLRHRLDDLGAPGTRIAHERPAYVECGLRQRAGGIDLIVRAEVRLLFERVGIVRRGVAMQC